MRLIVIAAASTLIASANAGGSFWQPIDLNRPGTLKGAQGRVFPARID